MLKDCGHILGVHNLSTSIKKNDATLLVRAVWRLPRVLLQITNVLYMIKTQHEVI